MPANTPKGLPYPLPTEPVAEGAQAIRNLAEALDGKLPIAACQASVTASNWPTAAVTIASLTTEEFDNDGMHDPAVTPSRIFARSAGRYLALASWGFSAVSTAGSRGLTICKNSNGVGNAGAQMQTGQSAAQTSNTFLGLMAWAFVQMAVNDYLEAHVYQDSGAIQPGTVRLFVARLF